MCIIVVKPRGAEPLKEELRNCFNNNSDGCGFVVNKGGVNIIRKGFFSFNRFYSCYKSMVDKDDPAVIHFRLATHGKIDGGNCHPFPVVKNKELLRATEVETKSIVVAHNGIIDIDVRKKGISDTMQFVIDILSDEAVRGNLYKSRAIQKLVKEYIGSGKLAFINSKGEILMIGQFIKNRGIYYSNNGYLVTYKKYAGYIGEYYYSIYEERDRYMPCDLCDDVDGVEYDAPSGLYLCESCRRIMYSQEFKNK